MLTHSAIVACIPSPSRRRLEEGRYISLSEAAAEFGLSHPQLKLLARKSRLRAFKIGRSWVTTRAAVAEYLANPVWRSKDPHKYKRGG